MEFSYKKAIILGLGLFTTGITWNLFVSYVPIFLSYYGIAFSIIGLIMTFDNFTAISIQPYIGTRSDKTWSHRFGRRMPYILIGIPIAAFFFALIPLFIPKDLINFGNYSISLNPDIVSFGFLITWIICFDIAMAIYRSPVTALIPDLIDNEHRSKANGVVQLMGGIGAIFAYTIGAILYSIHSEIPFLVTSIVMIIALCVLVIKIKEPEVSIVKSDNKSEINLINGFKEVFSKENRSLLYILLATFCWYFGYQAIATWFTTYGVRVLLIGEAVASSYLTLIVFPFILSTLPSGILGEKISRRKTIFIGLLLIISCFLIISIYSIIFIIPIDPILIPLFRFNPPNTLILLILISFPIIGVGWGFIEINAITIVWNMAGKEKQGTYTGIYYFFSQAAAIVGPPLIGLTFDLTKTQLPLFPISLIFFILALMSMFFVKNDEYTQK